MNNIKIYIFTISLTLFLFSSSSAKDQDYIFNFNSKSDYWPTNGWKVSTPEKQGMNSNILSSLMKVVNENNEPINSILIIRNGYIVVEANKNEIEDLHPLWSSTKSVSSALLGIAHMQGLIESVDQPLTDFFHSSFKNSQQPDWPTPTLYHLLTMSTGVDWPEVESGSTHYENPLYQMQTSDNWIEYVLGRKLISKPGTKFNYNSGGSHLLIGVLIGCKLDVEKFAYENLFLPLGITREDYRWSQDPTGIPNGSHGLVMKPRDMGKIGYLYLKGGVWDDKELLSKQWILDSTKRHISINWGGKIANHYGYQWYIQPYGFHSMGYLGQFIFILPNHNLVAVFTSEMAKHELEVPIKLVEKYLIDAVQSQTEIANDKIAYEKLSEQIAIFNN